MAATTLHNILVHMVVDKVSDLEFDRENLPEVEIGSERFCIISVYKDIGVQSVDDAALTQDYACRFHIECYPEPTTIHNTSQVQRFAAHVFITGHGTDGSAQQINFDGSCGQVILDTDSLRQSTAAKSSPPLCARNISHVGTIDTNTLKTKYKAYIDAINGRNMSQTLSAFCHDVVTHNGNALPLSKYRRLMEDAQAIIPDLDFSIASSLVDFDRQLLAARLDFRGTPTGEFAGVTPSEGAGKEVRFSEIVFYWFEDGKIAEVVSLVDFHGYRKQVTGQH